MPTVIICFLLVVLLTAVISAMILYGQYRRWPVFLWKQRLVRRSGELRARRFELTMPDPDGTKNRERQLADDMFDRHLQS